ncbi:MAG: protein translocase subunit SecF [Candidatus Hydrothermarchaeales archaeon]
MSFITEVEAKKLIIIPLSIMFISIIMVGINWQNQTIPMGIDFKGGTQITIQTSAPISNLERDFKSTFGGEPRVHVISDFSGSVVEQTIELDERDISIEKRAEMRNFISRKGVPPGNINIRTMGGSLPEQFLSQAIKAIFVAFLVMAIVVFTRFKTFIPSIAVVLSATGDIFATLAIMILLDIQLTLGSVVALLLLVGYSVDTDMMLTTRVLMRKEGEVNERIEKALITGLTMSGTTLCAMTVLLIVSTSVVLDQIATVILIGLVIDSMSTWLQTNSLLRWYVESV